jgi:hypothetical protein
LVEVTGYAYAPQAFELSLETNGSRYDGAVAYMPTAGSASLSTSLPGRLTVVIHNSPLYCDCLTRSIKDAVGDEVVSFASVEEWLASPPAPAALVLVCISGMASDVGAQQLDSLVVRRENQPPVVVLGDCEVPEYVRWHFGQRRSRLHTDQSFLGHHGAGAGARAGWRRVSAGK